MTASHRLVPLPETPCQSGFHMPQLLGMVTLAGLPPACWETRAPHVCCVGCGEHSIRSPGGGGWPTVSASLTPVVLSGWREEEGLREWASRESPRHPSCIGDFQRNVTRSCLGKPKQGQPGIEGEEGKSGEIPTWRGSTPGPHPSQHAAGPFLPGAFPGAAQGSRDEVCPSERPAGGAWSPPALPSQPRTASKSRALLAWVPPNGVMIYLSVPFHPGEQSIFQGRNQEADWEEGRKDWKTSNKIPFPEIP